MPLNTDGLRKRVLDTLDLSPYRGEIHVSEPQNDIHCYGTRHTVVFGDMTVDLEFLDTVAQIIVRDGAGIFARSLMNDYGDTLLVGARDLHGVAVHGRIHLDASENTYTYLALDNVNDHREFEAVLRAAMHVALDFAVLME